MRHPFRRKHLGPRLLPFYACGALAFWLARPSALTLAAGGALIAAGSLLRAWGAGHLRKNDDFVVSGPYAHLRHPLYAGTLLIGTGFGVAAGTWGLVLVVGFLLPVFFVYYLPYKDRIESARLERRYGAAYAGYRDAVPRLLPSAAAWTPPPGAQVRTDRRWTRERFRENHELGTQLFAAAALALLALRPAW